jgi:hypothetical protein
MERLIETPSVHSDDIEYEVNNDVSSYVKTLRKLLLNFASTIAQHSRSSCGNFRDRLPEIPRNIRTTCFAPVECSRRTSGQE